MRGDGGARWETTPTPRETDKATFEVILSDLKLRMKDVEELGEKLDKLSFRISVARSSLSQSGQVQQISRLIRKVSFQEPLSALRQAKLELLELIDDLEDQPASSEASQ